MTKEPYALREKKIAKTKIALANAFVERLKTTRFANISIKEVCKSVEISEGTFYNYFPQKVEIVLYFHSLTMLKVAWNIEKMKGKLSPLELIDLTFDLLSKEIELPHLFYEFVSISTTERRKPEKEDLTPAEKYYACPDCPGIENISFTSIDNFFLGLLDEAKKLGELKKKIKPEDIALLLHSILIGTPLAIEIEDFNNLPKFQKRQLSLLWEALKTN